MNLIVKLCLRWVWLLVIGAGIAFLLVGCGRSDPKSMPEEKLEPGVTRYSLGTFGPTFYEFKLSDGTRCIAYSQQGGVACEWKK